MSTGPNRTRQADLALGVEGLLINVLTGLPRFDGAACSGRWSIFEPQRDGERRDDVLERHHDAEQLCATCPALAPCRDWADGEPLDGSVIGGRSTARFPGRPHHDAA